MLSTDLNEKHAVELSGGVLQHLSGQHSACILVLESGIRLPSQRPRYRILEGDHGDRDFDNNNFYFNKVLVC